MDARRLTHDESARAGADVTIAAHHLIFGELSEIDAFNWKKKIEIAGKLSEYPFAEYEGRYEEFCREFTSCFSDPRRFTYTPAICCRGRKPFPADM